MVNKVPRRLFIELYKGNKDHPMYEGGNWEDQSHEFGCINGYMMILSDIPPIVWNLIVKEPQDDVIKREFVSVWRVLSMNQSEVKNRSPIAQVRYGR